MFEQLNTAARQKDTAAVPLVSLSDLYREGQTFTEVCVKLGIPKHEYYRACKLSKLFKNEHEYGLMKSEAWWSTLGRAGAAGARKIQPAAWIFTMKNRFNWSDKRELTTKPGDTADIENNTIKPDMTPDEAAKKYNDEVLNKV